MKNMPEIILYFRDAARRVCQWYIFTSHMLACRHKAGASRKYKWLVGHGSSKIDDEGNILFYISYDYLTNEQLSVFTVSDPSDMTALLLEKILSTTQTAIFWKDAERRFLGANKAFLDYYDFVSVKDILGRTDEDMGWHDGTKEKYYAAAPDCKFEFRKWNDYTEEAVAGKEIILGNIPVGLIKYADSLKWIQLHSAGNDAYARDPSLLKDIILTNASGCYGLVIAEYMVGAVIGSQMNLFKYDRAMKRREWTDEGRIHSVMEQVRGKALELFTDDPGLIKEKNKGLRSRVEALFGEDININI